MRNDKDIVEAIKCIFNEPGIKPEYHKKQIEHLAVNWPMLYRLLKSL